MAEMLGRSLAPGEVVHHKNLDTADDRLGNLEAKIRGKHQSDHMRGNKHLLGFHHSEESKARIRASTSRALMGHLVSEETRQKIRAKALGRKPSEGTRQKMSVAHRGNQRALGYRHTEESREKMRQAWCSRKEESGVSKGFEGRV